MSSALIMNHNISPGLFGDHSKLLILRLGQECSDLIKKNRTKYQLSRKITWLFGQIATPDANLWTDTLLYTIEIFTSQILRS